MKVAKKSLKDKIPEMIAYWDNKEFLNEESQDYLNLAKEALKNNELSNVCEVTAKVHDKNKNVS